MRAPTSLNFLVLLLPAYVTAVVLPKDEVSFELARREVGKASGTPPLPAPPRTNGTDSHGGVQIIIDDLLANSSALGSDQSADTPSLPPLPLINRTHDHNDTISVVLPGFGTGKPPIQVGRKRGADDFTIHFTHAAANLTDNAWLYGLPIEADELRALLQRAVDTTPRQQVFKGRTILSVENNGWMFVLRASTDDPNLIWIADFPKVVSALRAAALEEEGPTHTFAGTITDPNGQLEGELGMFPVSTLTPAASGPDTIVHPLAQTDTPSKRNVASFFLHNLYGYGITSFRRANVFDVEQMSLLLQSLNNVMLLGAQGLSPGLFNSFKLRPGGPERLGLRVDFVDHNLAGAQTMQTIVHALFIWFYHDSGILTATNPDEFVMPDYSGSVYYRSPQNLVATWQITLQQE
ncbi:MAG: hypothetical protein M1817_000349 [Caeruleum heppii]|nr:MAG: hypothetical protein M1817_000349 [Caeruleum heppii]